MYLIRDSLRVAEYDWGQGAFWSSTNISKKKYFLFVNINYEILEKSIIQISYTNL